MKIPIEQERKYGPRCPNHQVVLILTNDPGVGICPISKCEFNYEPLDENTGSEKDEVKIDSNGNMITVKSYKIKKRDENDPRE